MRDPLRTHRAVVEGAFGRDGRDGRFESEVRVNEMEQQADIWRHRDAAGKKIGFCNRCKRVYEDCSKFCPRCSQLNRTNEMGVLRPIPERFREEARRKAAERARREIRERQGAR